MRPSCLCDRRRAVAAVAVVGTAILVTSLRHGTTADEVPAKKPDLVGVWKLAGRLGEDGQIQPLEGQVLKFIIDGQWTVTYSDPESGRVQYHHGGTYTLEGNKYSEKISYATEATQSLFGQTFNFEVQVDGDSLTQKGVGNPYNEVWKRLKQ
jgi:hypothetical protein